MLAVIVLIAAIITAVFISVILFVTDEGDHEIIETVKEETEMFKPICYGAEGREIMEIQKLLKEAGSSIKVNGLYTIGMVSAVKTFQKKNGLAATGKIDLKTMNKLKTFAKPEKKAPAKSAKKAK